MFAVAAFLGLLICAGNEFHVGETLGCAWEVAITISMNPCTNTSLMLTDHRNPEAILASLGTDQATVITQKFSFLGKFKPFDQSLIARIKCKTVEESRARSRTYALSGGRVHITYQHRTLFGQSLSGDQYISKQYSAAMMDISDIPGCDSYHKCPPGATCDPVWIVPLQHDNCVLAITGFMLNEGTGQLLPMTTFIAEVTGLMPNVSSHKDRDLTVLQTAVVPLLHMPRASSFVTLGGFDNSSTLLLSETEFDKVVVSKLEDVYPEVSMGKVVCDCDALHGRPRLYTTGTLSDRHLLLTSIGLIEVYGMLVYMNDTSDYAIDYPRGNSTPHRPPEKKSVVSYKRCAHRMILPIQDTAFYQYVMLTGACQDKGRLFVARIKAKISTNLEFTELLPPDGKPLGSLFAAPSHIIATAQSAVSGGRFYTLLETSQSGSPMYAVTMTTRHSGSTSNELLSVIPQQIPSITLDEPLMLSQALLTNDDPMEKLVLRGISSTSRLSGHLFVWGSRILHSPNFGYTFYLLPAYAPDEVVLLETSRRGYMVFLTARQEIFVGVTEISKVTKIWPTDAWDVTHARHNLPTLPSDVHIVTVFFDQQDNVNLLYVSTSGTPSTVLKHSVPLTDILTLLAFHEIWTRDNSNKNAQGVSRAVLDVHPLCPFSLIKFVITDIKRYTKLQEVMHHPPFVVREGRANWHTKSSLLFFHAIIRNITSYMKRFHFETYTHTGVSPIDRWREHLSVKEPFFKYIYQTIWHPNPEYLQPDNVQLIQPKITVTKKLPDIVYLDSKDSFHFTMMVMPSQKGDWDSLHIGVIVTNGSLIGVKITKNWDMHKDMMTYEIVIHHRGTLDGQMAPGTGLTEESVQFFFHGAPIHCYGQNEKHSEPQGIQQLSVMLGCPPNLHILFDWNATKQKLYEDSIQQTPIDCLYPDPDLPCFYYDNGFYPTFRVFDDTLFNSWIFEGNYTLKVIGGSSDRQTIRNFTKEEVFAYNNMLGPDISLIWSGIDDIITNDGWHLYNIKQNGIRWLCQPHSPCSGDMPKFPSTPEFFLLIEFTNRDVDRYRTNCNFTFTFVVHLHGLPIDAVSTSLPLIGVAVGLISLYLLIYFLVYCHHGVIYKRIQIYYHTRVKTLCHKNNPEDLQHTVRLLYSKATPLIMCDTDTGTITTGMPLARAPTRLPILTEVIADDTSSVSPKEGEGDFRQ